MTTSTAGLSNDAKPLVNHDRQPLLSPSDSYAGPIDPTLGSVTAMTQEDSSSYQWPRTAAKLYMPLQWQQSGYETCTIEFDSSRQLLKIVDEERSVIDIINPMDIIGVDAEIKLFDTSDTKEVPGTMLCGEKALSVSNGNSPTSGGAGLGCNVLDAVSQNQSDQVIAKDTQGAAILNIYSYPKSSPSSKSLWCSSSHSSKNHAPNPHYISGKGPRHARHYSFPVAPAHDFEALTELIKAIRTVSLLLPNKRKYLVILNPKSGTGKARTIWSKTVEIMLEKEAGIDIVLSETQFPGHAMELMRDNDELLTYDAVICMGGDGVLHEMLQGCQARPDFQLLLRSLRLGVVGCGTGNGLAKSLTFAAEEHHSSLESAFLIARGQTLWMDLSKYETNQSTYTSFLTFTWAMIADLDIDSEVIRCLGDMRLDIWAVICVARGRKYRGRLSYLPPPAALKNCESQPTAIDMPRLMEPVPSTWTVIEDDIYLLWASQVSHAAEGSYHSPPSHMQDGVFQIMLLRAGNRNVGRLSIATVLLSLASGSHATHPAVEFVECVAYRLEPLVEGSYNDLDGEVIESGPVQAQVMPRALQVFGHIPSAPKGE